MVFIIKNTTQKNMTQETYWKSIYKIVDHIRQNNLSIYDYFDYSKQIKIDSILLDAINIKTNLLNSKEEKDYYATIKETGIYRQNNLSDKQRLALLVISIDTKNYIAPELHEEECREYNINAPIFKDHPKLFSFVRKDLVYIGNAIVESSGQLVNFNNLPFIARVQSPRYSHFTLYQNLYDFFTGENLYLRINQNENSQSRLMWAMEEAIRPIDPKFLENLRLYRGEKKWEYYEVIEPSNCTDRQFWDYTQGYGRLEVVFKRNEDSLSCMIEELPREPNGRVLAGLCLHATTNCPIGTNWKDAIADHIDGAVNYYFDERALERLESNISVAECSASCRTHLFRIENIKLSNLLQISKLFFQASSLWEDWIKDQFHAYPEV